MVWEKRGRVFQSGGQYSWMVSHAANPFAEPIEGSLFRVYFSCRDAENRSSIGFVVIDLNRPQEIVEVSSEPVLGPGKKGCFDDSGASMGCILSDGEVDVLFYLGWMLGVTVPFLTFIGAAERRRGEHRFERVTQVPVLDRSRVNPFSVSYPWVVRRENDWAMWYGSSLEPTPMDRKEISHSIRFAESSDRKHWRASDSICAGDTSGVSALTRPSVIVEDNRIYRMWYSMRGEYYRIGYAESTDGLNWRRIDDERGLLPSGSTWESESVCYPCVVKYEDMYVMFYNGNDYGRTGFGLATCDG
jgi:predicted GH43/DUF377 family glycosyl hydrolase